MVRRLALGFVLALLLAGCAHRRQTDAFVVMPDACRSLTPDNWFLWWWYGCDGGTPGSGGGGGGGW